MRKAIIKNREDETKEEIMEFISYSDMGSYYEFKMENGIGYLPKERVIKILERHYQLLDKKEDEEDE